MKSDITIQGSVSGAPYMYMLLGLLLSLFSVVSAFGQDDPQPTKLPQPGVGGVLFLNNGQTIGGTSCGNYDRLAVVYYLPVKVGRSFDRVKFTLTINGEEYRTRNFEKTEIYYRLAGKTAVAFTVAVADSSDFADITNQYLTAEKLCTPDPNKPLESVEIVAEGKGYNILKKEKGGKPIYNEPEVFSTGRMSLRLGKVQKSTSEK
jgi:hypothetical protein